MGTLENVQLIQLSKHNIAVTFNKRALIALKNGGSEAIVLKQPFSKDITFLFMRDTDFNSRYAEFAKQLGEQRRWWHRFNPFKGKARVGVKETPNRKYGNAK